MDKISKRLTIIAIIEIIVVGIIGFLIYGLINPAMFVKFFGINDFSDIDSFVYMPLSFSMFVALVAFGIVTLGFLLPAITFYKIGSLVFTHNVVEISQIAVSINKDKSYTTVLITTMINKNLLPNYSVRAGFLELSFSYQDSSYKGKVKAAGNYTRRCPKCGSEYNAKEERVCHYCGERLQ